MFIFGYEKFKENGDPLDNCIDYSFEGWRICDNSNILLNMFQHMDWKYLLKDDGGEFKKGMSVRIKNIYDLKDEKYFFPISVKEFSGALGKKRFSEKIYKDNIFNHIPEKVLEDVRSNKCKIIIDFGYEGFGSERQDTILFKPLLELLHKILKRFSLPQENIIYMDANVILDGKHMGLNLPTKVSYIHYEYCAIDWWRFTMMHPSTMYHGNEISDGNKKRWLDTKDKLRDKYFLSFNRLPKEQRIALVLMLEKYNLLDKGYVSFGNITEECKTDPYTEWQVNLNWEYYNKELKPYEKTLMKKLPLVIDRENLDELKYSFELFDISYYLNSYFQIVTENQFTDFEDQLQFSEKVWKPITNFQPFILLGDHLQMSTLRDWGFKTFEPYIDESYDDCLNITDRFRAVEKEILKLCMMSPQEIHEWYWSMEDILIHNYNHFYENFIKDQKKELIRDISNV
tara:strand:- start:3720 stop:5087 length:1368 start_codon:yes stop_codon:yes gene_type:complete